MKRRTFLKATAGSAAGSLMLGLPKGWAGGAYADDSPETKTMRFGIIALTDCSPIVMAHELGYFKQFGIESVISKEASWAVIRDKLSMAFGKWWLSQFRRWGMVKGAPDYSGITKRVLRPDLYAEAMKEMGITRKVVEVQKFKFWDGVTFDAADPEKYATSFPIHSLSS